MNDKYYMELALLEAKKAMELDEVPIGCVIVRNNEVIATSYNRKNIDNIATYHAEILAIEQACKKLNTWYLDDCTLYTTVEPCMMCTGAIIQARIKKIIYGTPNETFGYLSKIDTKTEIISGILEHECQEILSQFFKNKRHNTTDKK